MDVDVKQLKAMAKAVNESGIREDQIKITGKAETIWEDFCQAIEEINADNRIDELDQEIVEFYESNTQNGGGEGFDSDEVREKLSEMDIDELGEFVRENELDVDFEEDADEGDVIELIMAALEAAAGGEEGGGDGGVDVAEVEERLKEMDRKGLKEFIKENEMEIKVTAKMEDDDIRTAILDIVREQVGEAEATEGTGEEIDLEALDRKALKALIKENELDIKVTAKMSDDDIREAIKEAASGGEAEGQEDEGIDLDDLKAKLAEMDRKALKDFIKDNDMDIKVTAKMDDDDIVTAILEFVEAAQGGKKDAPKKSEAPKKTTPAKGAGKGKPPAPGQGDLVSAFGHKTDSMSGYIDECLLRGSTIGEMAEGIVENFKGKTEQQAVNKIMSHIRYLPPNKGVPIVFTMRPELSESHAVAIVEDKK